MEMSCILTAQVSLWFMDMNHGKMLMGRSRYLQGMGQKGKDVSSSAAVSVWEGQVQVPSCPHLCEKRFVKGGRDERETRAV